MAKPKPATPRANLQVEMPTTLISALDLLASRANKGAGITRSHLVRAVLAEYVELRLGPSLRKAIAAWDEQGGALLDAFMRRQLGDAVPTDPVSIDPLIDRNYNANPLDDEDPLHKVAEMDARRRQDSPAKSENGGNKGGVERIEPAMSIAPEFAKQNELQAPTPTESEYVAADPARGSMPPPTHFPLRSDYDAPKTPVTQPAPATPPPRREDDELHDAFDEGFRNFDEFSL